MQSVNRHDTCRRDTCRAPRLDLYTSSRASRFERAEPSTTSEKLRRVLAHALPAPSAISNVEIGVNTISIHFDGWRSTAVTSCETSAERRQTRDDLSSAVFSINYD